MLPAADGSPGLASPPAPVECARGTTAFDRAIDVIEQELALTQGNVARVLAACADARLERTTWSQPDRAQRLRQLTRLAVTGSNAARQPLVELLYDVAEAAEEPWEIFGALLASHDPSLCGETLERMLLLVSRGTRIGTLAETLAHLVECGPGPLREPGALEKIRSLLRGPPGDERNEGIDLDALYANAAAPAGPRRLAARLLDLSPSPPAQAVAVQVLGHDLAEYLEPYLAYTTATHLDLLNLAAGGVAPDTLLASLRAVEETCGVPLFRNIVSALGWRSLNAGVTVERWVGLSVGGSFPVIVSPGEASLLERCAGVQRLFERLVVVAHAAQSHARPVTPSRGGAVDRFRACNLRHADLLIDLLDVAPLTEEKVRRLLNAVDTVLADFEALFQDRYPDECSGIRATYAGLASAIGQQLESSGAGQPLPADLTRLVQMFEDPGSPSDVRTLHGCKRYLHQRGLQLGASLAESADATNRAVTLALASFDEVLHVLRSIEYADFESREEEPSVPHVVRAAVEAFARQLVHGERAFPTLRLFCYGNEVHCFAAFRNHPAFIRVDFSPPQRGGMIDLEYCGVSKFDLEWHPNVSLDAIQEIFRALDFEVQVVNTRIHARYDKERAADLRDLGEKLQGLFRLVPYLMDVDWVVADLDLSRLAKREVAVAWGEFFRTWGTLPIRHVLTVDRRGILADVERTPAGTREVRWSGADAYHDRLTVAAPPGFWASARVALEECGIQVTASTDGERPVSQQSLEATVLSPFRKILAQPPQQYIVRHEATILAHVLSGDDATLLKSSRLARVLARLAGGLRLETTGSVNGYDVQRASLALPDEAVGLYALCDAAGIPRLTLFSHGDTLYETRAARDAVVRNWSVDADPLLRALRRGNFGVEWLDDEREPAGAAVLGIRDAFRTPNTSPRPAPLEGERWVGGVKASPGRAVGLARPGLAGRRPADLEGGILIAPALGPRDNPFVFRSSGIVSTGGGVLSHAGLLALQFRKPALVVSGRWERTSSGADSLVYSCATHRELRTRVGHCEVVERHDAARHDERIQDGDLVVLDADEGTLSVLGQGHDALALHDHSRQLAASSRSLAVAGIDAEVLAHRGRLLRARHQLEKLLARIRDPALARFAAAELLVGEVGAEPGVRQDDKARLLRSLFGNRSIGVAVFRTVEAMAVAIGDRAAALAAQAARLIPTSQDALEVLTLRLEALRSRELLENVLELLSESGMSPPARVATPEPDLEALSLNQLQAQRATALSAVAAALDMGGSTPVPRHALRQLEHLQQVVDSEAAEREVSARARTRLDSEDNQSVRSLSSRRTLGPSDGGLELWPLVGSKAANLAEAERLGEGRLIPRWFVVTDRAFREVLALPVADATAAAGGATLGDFIDRTIGRRDLPDAQKSLIIGEAWRTIELPASLVMELAAAYRVLASAPAAAERDPAEDSEAPFVAVRSSAREEDLETASRAGEFDTFLFVRGLDGISDALRRAWSGLWTERAIHNRAVLSAGNAVGGGVLIQKMVWARVSGVLHTINLAEGRLREMVVNAGLGLGEGIVSGAVAADLAVVSKQESLDAARLRFRYFTNDKRERVVFDAAFGSGTRRVEVLPYQRLRPALEYVELSELASAAARLESAYRQPLDIEFAIEGTGLYLLQVRPVPAALAAWRDTIERHALPRRRT